MIHIVNIRFIFDLRVSACWINHFLEQCCVEVCRIDGPVRFNIITIAAQLTIVHLGDISALPESPMVC